MAQRRRKILRVIARYRFFLTFNYPIMPVTCRKSGDTYRVVEADGGEVVTNRKGTAVDGGGHETKEQCQQQAQAINANRETNSPSNNPRAAKRLRNPKRS